MKKKICGVYEVENTITGDCYVGSSRDVMHRWAAHKEPSRWKKYSNNPLYLDMQKYGVEKSNTGRESIRKAAIKYGSQLCSYNGETLTLRALASRFSRAGVEHPYLEAKKYLEEK